MKLVIPYSSVTVCVPEGSSAISGGSRSR